MHRIIFNNILYFILAMYISHFSIFAFSQTSTDSDPFENDLFVSDIIIEESGDASIQFPLNKPISIAHDSNGNIFILDSGNNCIVKYSEKGKYILHWGNEGHGPGEFAFGGKYDSIIIDESDKIYVSSTRNNLINIFNTVGKIIKSFRTERPPLSLSVFKNEIYISQNGYNEHDCLIHVYNNNGEKLRAFSTPLSKSNLNYNLITNDDKGNVYQAFEFLPIIRKYNAKGKLLFEKRIDLRKLKPRGMPAEYWYNMDIDNPPFYDKERKSHLAFLQSIHYNNNKIFLYAYDIYVLSPLGEVKGVYKYDSNISHLLIPTCMIVAKNGNFLVAFQGDNSIGAAYLK